MNRAALRAALATVNRGTPGIPPRTLTVWVQADPATPTAPQTVTLTATDGDRTVTVELPADTLPAGAVPVIMETAYAPLAATIKGKGPRTVALTPAENAETIRTPEGAHYRGAVATVGAMTYALPAHDAPGPDAGYAWPAPSSIIAEGGAEWAPLVPVAAIASTDRARPILTAVSLRASGTPGIIEAAGTDSYRLACRIVAGPDLPAPILVPADVITLAAKNADTGTLAVSEDRYRITAGPLRVGGFLTAGEFPNYHQLAPAADALAVWTVDRAQLATVASTAAARNGGKGPGPLIITAGPDGITAETANGMTARITGTGPDTRTRFGVNPSFLGSALAADTGAAGPLVTFRTDTPLRPFYVDTVGTGVGLAVTGRTLVMPVRVA
jgi:hypothetical protein